MGGSWVFSNKNANKFELTTALQDMPMGENGQPLPGAQEEMTFFQTRSDSSGRLEFGGQVNLGGGISFRPEIFFMDGDLSRA